MNERVWLEAAPYFVNTLRAVLVGFVLLAGCSRQEESTAPTPQPSASASPTLQIPVIWETEEAAYPIVDLAFSTSPAGRTYLNAVLGDGRLQVFDLDGAVVSTGDQAELSFVASGGPIVADGAELSSVVVSDADGALSLALTAAELKATGFAPLTEMSHIAALCSDASQSTESGVVVVGTVSGGRFSRSAVSLADKQPSISSLSPDGETPAASRACALNAAGLATLATTEGVYISDKAGDLRLAAPEDARDLALVNAAGRDVLVWIDRKDGSLHASLLTDGAAGSGKPFELRPGITVMPPRQATTLAAFSGAVSVDYPDGVLAVTGYYENARPRVVFVNAATLVDAVVSAESEPGSTGP